MQTSLYDYCMERSKAALLTQWHPAKNGALTPQQIAYGSTRKVWWICAKGHIWQAAVNTRTANHTDCPYCAGRLPWPGETDLASQYQDLVKEWHPTRNLPLTPEQVLPGSEKKVWWKCAQGHEWQAEVRCRTLYGNGCPFCANRAVLPGFNDLATLYPELAAEWHPTKNGALTPEQVLAGSEKRVWWQCGRGHAWQTSVSTRTRANCRCPVCAGRTVLAGENDLATLSPELAAEWHPTLNGALTPDMVTAGSNKRVWWQCRLGHVWRAVVARRSMDGAGCPYCTNRKVLAGFNDLTTVHPELVKQWHPTLNGDLTPDMVTPGTRKRAWWICPEGHVWNCAISSRTAGRRPSGCPVCAGKAKENPRYEAVLRACPEQESRRRGGSDGFDPLA